jgi:uncharacterized protein
MANKRRHFLAGAAAFAGATIAGRVARADKMQLRVTRHRIPWPGEKKLRIAHITDVHVGWGTPTELLAEVAEVAWQVEPDLVALTGDYVNRDLSQAERLRSFVTALPKPVIATLGNHDHWANAAGVTRVLEQGGAEVLRNRASGIDGLGFALDVVGVDDGFSRHDDLEKSFAGIAAPERALVLSHYPATAEKIAKKGANLIISGHTHGGQVVVPVLTQALMSLVGTPYVHGWFDFDESQLYVSAGVGQSLEGLRGGTTAVAEIAVYDLDPSAKSRESKTYRVR